MQLFNNLILGFVLFYAAQSAASAQDRAFQCESSGITSIARLNFPDETTFRDSFSVVYKLPSGKTLTRMAPHKTASIVTDAESGQSVLQYLGAFGGIVIDLASAEEQKEFMDGLFFNPNTKEMKKKFLTSLRISEKTKTAKLYFTTMIMPNHIPSMTAEQLYFFNYSLNNRNTKHLAELDPDYIVENAKLVMDCIEINAQN